MTEYDVLNNYSFLSILMYAVCGMIVLCVLADYLGSKDACTSKQKKSIFRKVAPWGVLCVFLSELTLLFYRLIYYPWAVEPQPSKMSIVKEMQYGTDNIVLWGWANDRQLPILSSLGGTALWLFWTIYAFRYRASETSWWKKTCKVMAYITISISVLGFNIHSFIDFLWWGFLLIIVVVLLKISSVKKPLQEDSPQKLSVDKQIQFEETLEKPNNDSVEYNKRFMPKTCETESDVDSNKVSDANSISNPAMNQVLETLTLEEKIFNFSDVDVSKIDDSTSCVLKTEKTDENLMFCKYCGKRIESDSLFCKYCGRKL